MANSQQAGITLAEPLRLPIGHLTPPSGVDSAQLRQQTYDLLVAYLDERFDVDVQLEELDDFRSMLFTTPDSSAKTLVVSNRTSQEERVYLAIHACAHILLGDTLRPYVTILEPAPHSSPAARLTGWRLEEHELADKLTKTIILGSSERFWDSSKRDLAEYIIRYLTNAPHSLLMISDAKQQQRRVSRDLSGLLPNETGRLFRAALSPYATRRAMMLALRLFKEFYHLMRLQRALRSHEIVKKLRRMEFTAGVVAPTETLGGALPRLRRGESVFGKIKQDQL